jgi:hypothetical protein
MNEINDQPPTLAPDPRQDRRHSETIVTSTPGEHSQSRSMKYYDLKRNWHRVKPHLGDKELNDILVRDFNKFTFGRWNRKFTYGDLPCEFESCDWDIDHRGRRPAFWSYVKHSACHWLVNFSLRLATLVRPKKQWRIITSEGHSTVWDGHETLFDLTFRRSELIPMSALISHSTRSWSLVNTCQSTLLNTTG